jgi:hypothetical protein
MNAILLPSTASTGGLLTQRTVASLNERPGSPHSTNVSSLNERSPCSMNALLAQWMVSSLNEWFPSSTNGFLAQRSVSSLNNRSPRSTNGLSPCSLGRLAPWPPSLDKWSLGLPPTSMNGLLGLPPTSTNGLCPPSTNGLIS